MQRMDGKGGEKHLVGGQTGFRYPRGLAPRGAVGAERGHVVLLVSIRLARAHGFLLRLGSHPCRRGELLG